MNHDTPPRRKDPPPSASPTKKPPPAATTTRLTDLPTELQVNLLTYLRAFDLASVQQTCLHFARPALVHAIVEHTAQHVYPAELTAGFEEQATTNTASTASHKKPAATSKQQDAPNKDSGYYYTFEHLRNMELLVIARVLSRPEPPTGYIVSKSWCKTALKWLEVQQEEQQKKLQQQSRKHISKRKHRVRQRRLSDASPPWPNVNSDLLCEHEALQACSNSKQNRARRKVLDKQAWKILKKLYPDSTPLQSITGECLQCRLQEETASKTKADQQAALKLERQAPLSNPVLRRLYTRTRGVPSTNGKGGLAPGTYVVLPRAWLAGYRKYLKTGTVHSRPATKYPAPDATDLLCPAHRLVLLPPHLEQYLQGRSTSLWSTTTSTSSAPPAASIPGAAAAAAPVVSDETRLALQAAGLSEAEVRRQLQAMQSLERQQEEWQDHQQQEQPSTTPTTGLTKNQLLDRENACVVELVTAEEYQVLQSQWPVCGMQLSLEILPNHSWRLATPACTACDASGHAHAAVAHSCRKRNHRNNPQPPRVGPRALLEY